MKSAMEMGVGRDVADVLHTWNRVRKVVVGTAPIFTEQENTDECAAEIA